MLCYTGEDHFGSAQDLWERLGSEPTVGKGMDPDDLGRNNCGKIEEKGVKMASHI